MTCRRSLREEGSYHAEQPNARELKSGRMPAEGWDGAARVEVDPILWTKMGG